MAADVWDYVNRFDDAALTEPFRSAEPFPHVCLDGFLQPDFAREVGRVFSGAHPRAGESLAPPTRLLAAVLKSGSLRRAISAVTGVPDLIADPENGPSSMVGMRRGDRCLAHDDAPGSAGLPLHRALGLIVFLHEHWEDGWGGAFDLWDSRRDRAPREITPVSNRAVLFEAGRSRVHGVSALRCPAGVVRKSLTTFYYTAQARSTLDHRPTRRSVRMGEKTAWPLPHVM